jgi:hypothetical protein
MVDALVYGVDYRLCMVDAWFRLLVYRLIGTGLQ